MVYLNTKLDREEETDVLTRPSGYKTIPQDQMLAFSGEEPAPELSRHAFERCIWL